MIYSEYRPSIDGLRAVAVLAVLVFHLNRNWLPGGFVGVDVFFVISGYLITSILVTESANGHFRFTAFYQRRIARIFPVLAMVAVMTLAAAAFIYLPQDLASTGANVAAAALSMTNMKLLLQGNYFVLSQDAQPLLHYWSLSVEEQFYLIFPAVFVLTRRYAQRQQAALFAALSMISLVASIVVTRFNPTWAFYLLPTRAWELLFGCVLAVVAARGGSDRQRRWAGPLSAIGIGAILLSFVVTHEGPQFPGAWPLLPALGTVAVLAPFGDERGWLARSLAAKPLVIVGRMSYSLYLWHWPVFSLVDYRLYQEPSLVRLGAKIAVTGVLAASSFWLLEYPARALLNRKQNKRLAYAVALITVAVCVIVGNTVRRANYVNAELGDVASGGLVFGASSQKGSVILMGDSNGSMYSKLVQEISHELRYKLTVLSVAAGDPLPVSGASGGTLWSNSLAVVRRERPDCIVLACAWTAKLGHDRERLALAVSTLKPLTKHLVILNQVPGLPVEATRESIRRGIRPPFREDARMRRIREEMNDFLAGFADSRTSVVDVASRFATTDGGVQFLDSQGRQLYQDAGHLSGFGAELVKAELRQAILAHHESAQAR